MAKLYLEQFPSGYEHLKLPPIVLFSIYMGPIKYQYFELTLESMRRNSGVDFVIVNIIPTDENDKRHRHAHRLISEASVPNLRVISLNLAQFHSLVAVRLGIVVHFTEDWYYKLCDYKPTLAHLFPDVIGKKQYKYWGYADFDVIWGNFSRYAHWFQGQYPFVISGWWRTTGALAAFVNEEWTRTFFMRDPLYVALLRNLSYHNLDGMTSFLSML